MRSLVILPIEDNWYSMGKWSMSSQYLQRHVMSDKKGLTLLGVKKRRHDKTLKKSVSKHSHRYDIDVINSSGKMVTTRVKKGVSKESVN